MKMQGKMAAPCTPLFVSPVPQSTHRVAMATFNGVHSIMMVNKPGLMGGGCTISTITYKVVVYVPAERADTLPIFLLYSVACPVRGGGLCWNF